MFFRIYRIKNYNLITNLPPACYEDMAGTSPLLVTLALDDASFQYFTALRHRYFPPERNFLSAHLTLFHHLPPDEPKIYSDLQAWSEAHAALSLSVTEVKSIGRGVAYKIDSPELLQLHRHMQAVWRAWLKPQDKHSLWPHITVQNKVTAEVAKQTLFDLQQNFLPFTIVGKGLHLWSYEGGPWEHIKLFPF